MYNADGSESAHWAKSKSMAKLGTQGLRKPTFTTQGKEKIKMPNQDPPAEKKVVPNPVTPPMPKWYPERRFKLWIPTVANVGSFNFAG